MNKKILIAILIVVIIGAGAYGIHHFAGGKINTQINFLSENALENGEQVEFELKDDSGKAISGQNVNLTFGDEKYSLVTDEDGKGYLVISEERAGKYEITVDYGGDDKHNGCSAKTTVTITDDSSSADDSTTVSSTNTSGNNSSTVSSDKGNSKLHYDAQYGLYYDDEGKVRNSGGQIDGMSIYDIRQRGGPFAGIN